MNRPPVSGETRLCAVIGDPVRHSLSPRIHNAAYEALGLDRVYVALPVPAGRGAAAVRAMVDLGIDGLNVTMPHKEEAATACDVLSADASALRSVNTVVRRADGALVGDSTAGEGFLRALADAGCDPTGRRARAVPTRCARTGPAYAPRVLPARSRSSHRRYPQIGRAHV